MSDGKIVIETDLDSSGLEQGLRKLGTAAQTGIKATVAAITVAGTALTAVGATAVKTGSDFEVQMSRVKAISQATEQEFEQLRNQAIELGASTAFSASEAAEGMESLAAAGFETSEIMDAMPGLLDLAAASGESLASSSDIAAAALRGFGLDASEAAHVADVLAANANKTNSSVADTGDAMKYVAPFARAAGISLEETAAAIGIMANAGIQGSQAGTTLRGALSRLSKPTDAMATVMEKLGLAFYDSNGKMKSLKEQIEMLSGAMDGLTDEQRNNYLVTLYGQEALSGMLALINEGSGSLNELTVAYKNCDGSAKEAAATMQDNLKGAVEELGGSLESFGIIIYDKLSGNLKEAAETATESVDKVSDAFKSGGLKGAVKEAGEVLDDFTDSVAESNEELAGIIKPVKNVAKTGLELGKKVLPVAANGFSLVAKNLDVLVPVLTAGVTAFKGYSVVNGVSAGIKGLSATVAMLTAAEKANALQVLSASGALTAKEVIVGVVTRKITLATAAQTAWNAMMNANLIGLVVTAIGALAAGLTVYKLVTDDATESTGKLTEEQQKTLEACNEVTTALNEERTAREENVQSISQEYDRYGALVSELQAITDANGKVKVGYEERAKVITGQLSNALGVEISMVDGVIQKYQETISAIKEVIVQKKAEALLSSMQSDMAKAYEKTTTAMQAYKDAAKTVEEANKEVEQATLEAEAAQQRYRNSAGLSVEVVQQLAEESAEADEKLRNATKAQKEAQATMDFAKNTLSELSAEVNNYNALAEAMATGETAKIEAAMTSLVTAYQAYSEESLKASEETRQAMYDQANSYVENMKLVQDGSVQVADSVYRDMSEAALNSILEFNKVPGGIAGALKEIGPEASSAMASALAEADLSGKLDGEAKKGIETFINGLSGLDEETQEVWSQAWYGALKGLEGFDTLADPAEEGVEAFLESLKNALEVHSPSHAVQAIFSQVWPGASEGLESGADNLSEKGNKVVKELLEAMQESDLLSGAKSVGEKIMTFFGTGITSKETDSEKAGKLNADAANEGAASIDPTGTGKTFGSNLSSGITAMNKTLSNAGNAIANSAKSGAGSVSPYSTGSSFSTTYASGIGSVRLYGAGQGRANDAKSGMGSVSASTTGYNFVQGFINGFGFADVWNAAWNIGKRALSALKNAIQEGSPSKLTRKSGGFFGEGFKLGILDEADAVAAASEKLGNVALSGIDVSGLVEKARAVVGMENARFSKAIAATVDYKVSGKMSDVQNSIDVNDLVNRMGNKFAEVLSGMGVYMDSTMVGKLVTEPVIEEMGRIGNRRT